MEAPPYKERWITANVIYSKLVRKLRDAFINSFGEKGREVFKQTLYEFGKELGAKLKEELRVQGKSLEDYGKLHYYQDAVYWGIEESVEMEKPNELVVRVSYCPLKGVFTAEDCKIWVPYLRGFIDALNPSISWKALKVLTRGDDCCLLTFTVKGSKSER